MDSRCMPEDESKKIDEIMPLLKEKLEPKNLLQKSRDFDLLTETECEDIRHERDKEKRVIRYVEKIKEKGNNAFEKFLKLMEFYGQDDIVHALGPSREAFQEIKTLEHRLSELEPNLTTSEVRTQFQEVKTIVARVKASIVKMNWETEKYMKMRNEAVNEIKELKDRVAMLEKICASVSKHERELEEIKAALKSKIDQEGFERKLQEILKEMDTKQMLARKSDKQVTVEQGKTHGSAGATGSKGELSRKKEIPKNWKH